MNSMFDCDVTISTSHKAEGFVAFFKEKIDDIRAATAGTQPPPVSCVVGAVHTVHST